MKSNKRFFAVLLCLALLTLSVLPISALNAMSITIACNDNDTPLVGAELEIFLVAKRDKYGSFSLTDDFSKYNVELTSRSLAYTLEGAVKRDGLLPLDSLKTDNSGYAVFPSENVTLEPGIYLVLSKKHIQNDHTYSISPFTVTLDGESINMVSVKAKYESEYNPILPLFTSRKVLKVWNDTDNESERPREITVTLLKDGEVYDTVVLSDDNNWRHTWDKLDAFSVWTVAENELEDYTVSISREGITFVITNTYSENPPDSPEDSTSSETTEPPETVDTSETTAPTSDTDKTTEPSETKPPETTEPAPDESVDTDTKKPAPDTTEPEVILPQTGQLRFPIPILIAVGLAFVTAGVICLRGGFRDEEN